MQKPDAKVNPVFKAGFNIKQRVALDNKYRDHTEYAQR